MKSTVENKGDFRVLSLDGGGAKGLYTLGILREVEAVCGRLLYEEFDLIYGTSTGAIIAAMLALGKSVDEVRTEYLTSVPHIMDASTAMGRTKRLKEKAHEIFGEFKFDAFKTGVGIVATHKIQARPVIFKLSRRMAFGGKKTFVPGFGSKISEAVMASCAAYPLFEPVSVKTENQGSMELLDGGFNANNPTLYAILDALNCCKESTSVRVLSLGTGHFKQPWRFRNIFNIFGTYRLALMMLETSTNTVEQLRSLIFPTVKCVRINESYLQDEYQADLLTKEKEILEALESLGSDSFRKFELDLCATFGWGSV